MNKPTVRYKKDSLIFIRLDVEAFLHPVDHYSPDVSNTQLVRTSQVRAYDKETGRLETQNTIYIPE